MSRGIATVCGQFFVRAAFACAFFLLCCLVMWLKDARLLASIFGHAGAAAAGTALGAALIDRRFQ